MQFNMRHVALALTIPAALAGLAAPASAAAVSGEVFTGMGWNASATGSLPATAVSRARIGVSQDFGGGVKGCFTTEVADGGKGNIYEAGLSGSMMGLNWGLGKQQNAFLASEERLFPRYIAAGLTETMGVPLSDLEASVAYGDMLTLGLINGGAGIGAQEALLSYSGVNVYLRHDNSAADTVSHFGANYMYDGGSYGVGLEGVYKMTGSNGSYAASVDLGLPKVLPMDMGLLLRGDVMSGASSGSMDYKAIGAITRNWAKGVDSALTLTYGSVGGLSLGLNGGVKF